MRLLLERLRAKCQKKCLAHSRVLLSSFKSYLRDRTYIYILYKYIHIYIYMSTHIGSILAEQGELWHLR